MAASPQSPVLPDLEYHYKHTLHTFVDHFEVYLQELVCPICQEIVEEPLQTSCGHIFCTECHRRSTAPPVQGSKRIGTPSHVLCPVCRQHHTTMKDDFNDRRAKSLKVRCKNHENGCEWVGSLADEKGHRENESGCASETCDKYPVKCPNGCNTAPIPRDELDHHKQEECPLQVVECQYKAIGCTEQVQRHNLESHLEKKKDGHLQLAMDAVVELTMKVDEMSVKIEELTAKVEENCTVDRSDDSDLNSEAGQSSEDSEPTDACKVPQLNVCWAAKGGDLVCGRATDAKKYTKGMVPPPKLRSEPYRFSSSRITSRTAFEADCNPTDNHTSPACYVTVIRTPSTVLTP